MEFDNNKWDSDENDTDYEDQEYIQNEVSPPEIDRNFVENILKVKHSLYDNIVLSPELGTQKAQNNTILQDYLNSINQVYILAVVAQRSKVKEQDLKGFPEKSKDEIKKTLDWITDYFAKNQVPDTIPYSDYIRKSFHEYQFVQNDNSFE